MRRPPLLRTAVLAAALASLPSVAPFAATPFDGAYKGGNTLKATKAGRITCPPGTEFTIRVENGEFTWRIDPRTTEKVKIGANGAFTAQSGVRFISGSIAGNKMTAETTGEYCIYTWALSK